MDKRLKFLIRLLVSIVILYFLITTVDINQSIKTFFRINPVVFVAMVAIYLSGQVLSAYKWSVISGRLGFDYKFSQYIKYYFTGMFFNLFLPTSVGGDVAKGYYLCTNKPETSKTAAFFSIFADRLTGLAVLTLICFVGLFFGPAQHLSLIGKSLIGFGFVAALLFFLFLPKAKKLKFLNKLPLADKCSQCVENLYAKSLIKIFALSLVFHLFMLGIHFCIGQTMGLNIPLSYYLILYPATAVLSILPISINGIGVREAAYVYLLGIIAINPAQGLAFALCWFSVVFISSLFSAIFYLKTEKIS